MALVVLLRGVNVGGHRAFRPTALARQLKHLGAVNIGAAGTFVIRKRVPRAELCAELAQWLPFHTDIVICQGREILRLMSSDIFAGRPAPPGVVRFASALVRGSREAPPLPISLPPRGRWLVRVLARDGRFVLGEYRRHMKTIGLLGALDWVLGAPVTTRNWNTMTAIVRVLEGGAGRGPIQKVNRGEG